MRSVAIIDYGMCNLDSVARAAEKVGASVTTTYDANEIRNATHLILPGVGAFPDAMNNIRERSLDTLIRERVANEIPLLGICLGMQLLASKGYEGKETDGLNLIPGEVKRLIPIEEQRIPHVGWNEVYPVHSCVLFKDINPGKDFYFVHSYHFVTENDETIAATTPYCRGFVSAVAHNKVFGTQFHPEKSQRAGSMLLTNFLTL